MADVLIPVTADSSPHEQPLHITWNGAVLQRPKANAIGAATAGR